jgi:multiple sugar transport system permease protein
MRISDSKYGFLLALPGAIFLAVMIAFPIGLLGWLSVYRYDYIHEVEFIGLDNFITVLSDRVFQLSFVNTFLYGTGVTVLTLIIALILALSVARIKKFEGFFRTLLIIPWAVPLVVSGLVWRWMLDPGAGIYNYAMYRMGLFKEPLNIFANPDIAMAGVIVADAWTRIPFLFIIILAAIKTIPIDLYEVARVDGASMIQTCRHITLPLIKRPTILGILITYMFSFRTIDVIWSMTRGGPGKATYVLGLNLLDYITYSLNLGQAAALGIIILILIVAYAAPTLYYLTKR